MTVEKADLSKGYQNPKRKRKLGVIPLTRGEGGEEHGDDTWEKWKKWLCGNWERGAGIRCFLQLVGI